MGETTESVVHRNKNEPDAYATPTRKRSFVSISYVLLIEPSLCLITNALRLLLNHSPPSLTACVEEKKKKISSLSEKLERLLTGYLDQVIDQPDYCLQKAKLLSEKKSLEEEIFNFSHK